MELIEYVSMNEPLDVDTLLSQGACCGNGCANCPYIDQNRNRHQIGVTSKNDEWITYKKKYPHKSYIDFTIERRSEKSNKT